MTHLQSCYFCGTTGALSEYETLPEGTTDEPVPRITLCTRCHTKLTNVLTPILEQMTAASESDATDQSADDVEADHSTTVRNASTTTTDESTPPEVTFSAPEESTAPNEAPSSEESETMAESDADSGPESHPEAVSEADETTDTGRVDEIDDAPAEPDDENPTEPDETEVVSDEREPADASADDGDEADDGDDAADTDDAADAHATDEADDAFPPRLERVYHKLLRFLRNREFPIPRAEAETVAQSAYDLSESEASQVLQRAIDKGVLEERGGELHRN